MANFSSTRMNAPATQVHAGVNASHATYNRTWTASGSNSISMIPLPQGARVLDVKLNVTGTHNVHQVNVRDGLGNDYIGTVTAVNSTIHTMDQAAVQGLTLTASTNLMVSVVVGGAEAGAHSIDYRLSVMYLADLEG